MMRGPRTADNKSAIRVVEALKRTRYRIGPRKGQFKPPKPAHSNVKHEAKHKTGDHTAKHKTGDHTAKHSKEHSKEHSKKHSKEHSKEHSKKHTKKHGVKHRDGKSHKVRKEGVKSGKKSKRTKKRTGRIVATSPDLPGRVPVTDLTNRRMTRLVQALVVAVGIAAVVILVLYFTCRLPFAPDSCTATTATATASTSTEPAADNVAVIVSMIVAIVLVALLLIIAAYWNTIRAFFFGGGNEPSSLEEDELLAELNSKASVKDAPEFYSLAFKVYQSTANDLDLTREEKIAIYVSLLQKSRSGQVGDFNDLASFKELGVPDGVLLEARARAEVERITGLKDIDSDEDLLQNELGGVDEAIKERVGALVRKVVEDVRAVKASNEEELSEEAQKVLDIALSENREKRLKRLSTWEGLASLPKELLERFKPLSQERTLFADQTNLAFDGPPGLGKTASIDAMLNQDPDLIVLRVDPSVLGENRGGSAKELKDRYEVLKKLKSQGKRAVLFIDEADAPLRDSEFASTLQIMMNDPDISVVIATNFYDTLPDAIQSRTERIVFKSTGRKGRMDVVRAELGRLRFKSTSAFKVNFERNLSEAEVEALARYKMEPRKIASAFDKAFIAAKRKAQEEARKSRVNLTEVTVRYTDVLREVQARYAQKSRSERAVDYVKAKFVRDY
jgi:DNA polymerase III delta prime subunit